MTRSKANKTTNTKKKVPKKIGRPKKCRRCKYKKANCICGRPTVITDEVIRKLKEGAMNSLTTVELSLYAGVGKTAVYEFLKKNPKFAEQIEALRKSPNLKAKTNILKSINRGSIRDSKRRLERRAKEEFSVLQLNQTTEFDLSGIDIQIITSPDEIENPSDENIQEDRAGG